MQGDLIPLSEHEREPWQGETAPLTPDQFAVRDSLRQKQQHAGLLYGVEFLQPSSPDVPAGNAYHAALLRLLGPSSSHRNR